MVVIMGVFGFALEPGLRYLGLDPRVGNLPILHSSFILNLNPLIVYIMAILARRDHLNRYLVGGIGIALLGVILYYIFGLGVVILSLGLGLLLTVASGIAWGVYQIVGQELAQNKVESLGVYERTILGFSLGSFVLFILSALTEPFVIPSISAIIIILVMGIANTGIAYVLWNKILEYLSATQTTLIQNTMLPQIAVLSIIFFSQEINVIMVLGMVIVIIGVIIGQIPKIKNEEKLGDSSNSNTDSETNQHS